MSQDQMTGMVGEQSQDVFERMFRAVELVQERLNRACRALREAKVPYAVIGGNAVAAWVAFSMRHGQIIFRSSLSVYWQTTCARSHPVKRLLP
jgi:hypothetical protein